MSQDIAYIDHARHVMRERGIEKEWVETTIRSPDIVRPDPSHPGRILAFRQVAAFGNRWLRVVYEVAEGPVVITAFFDRGMKS